MWKSEGVTSHLLFTVLCDQERKAYNQHKADENSEMVCYNLVEKKDYFLYSDLSRNISLRSGKTS